MIPTQATPPTIQLPVSPSDPLEPPPRSWKLGSMGAMVRPLAVSQANPRHTSKPPRVTMKEGTPT